MQNKMIETPGAKIRETLENRNALGGGGGGEGRWKEMDGEEKFGGGGRRETPPFTGPPLRFETPLSVSGLWALLQLNCKIKHNKRQQHTGTGG